MASLTFSAPNHAAPLSLQTSLTELFNLRYPILGGGLMWLSDAPYVAALVNAGCMGFITAKSHRTEASLRAEVKRCIALTDGRPCGVNLSLSHRASENVEALGRAEAALAEGARFFETAGNAPAPELIRLIHSGGSKVIHKVSSLRHALAAQDLGVDAIALVGMEAGGHPGMNDLPTSFVATLASRRLSVPFAVGGGIGTGEQMIAALALGAEAVVFGSRFLVCEEIRTHPDYKAYLARCDELATTTVLKSLKRTWRVLRNRTAEEVAQLEAGGTATFEGYGERLRGSYALQYCYEQGDWDKGMLSLGPAIAFANEVMPLAAIVSQLVEEAQAAMVRLQRLAQPG